MEINIAKHARERMIEYNISEKLVLDSIDKPDKIVSSYYNQEVFQKNLNGHVIRVIVEKSKEIKTIVTVYKARRKRYGI